MSNIESSTIDTDQVSTYHRGHPRPGTMDLRRIRHFVVLAETLNFRRAAERLHMAQPPLSVSIRKLEAELGTRLFERGSAGVVLTAGGHAALEEARRLLSQGMRLGEVARGVQQGTAGTLRVGFVGTATYGLLQRLLPAFRADHPGVELVLREGTSEAIVSQVEDRRLDIGIVRTPLLAATRAHLLPLEHDHLVLALPRTHRLGRGIRPLELSALGEEPFVMYAQGSAGGLRSAAMLACQAAGFVPRVAQEAVQVQTVLALVESGLGVGLVPGVMQRYASPQLRYRALADRPAASEVGLAMIGMPEAEPAAAGRLRALARRMFIDGDAGG